MNILHGIKSAAGRLIVSRELNTVLAVYLIMTMLIATISCGSDQKNGSEFQFRITGYEAIDDDGFPVLQVTFTNDSGVALTFLDGNGTELTGGSGYFPAGVTETKVALGRFGKAPSGGSYEVIVRMDPVGEIVTTETLTFEGAKLVIDDIELSWGYWPPDYRLTDVKFSLRNDGDMPAYVYSYRLTIGEKEASRESFREAVLPGEGRNMHTSMLDIGSIEAGQHMAYLEVRDSIGAVVSSHSFSVTPGLSAETGPEPEG